MISIEKEEMQTSVIVARTVLELQAHLSAWEDLASCAIDPNPFYEPWMLLPAVECLGGAERLMFVLIYANKELHDKENLLCGFFPLERRSYYRWLPLPYLRLWKHDYCFLCTPLLRSGYAIQALNKFFDWAASEENDCGIIEFGSVSADGSFQECDHRCTNEREWPVFGSGQYSRPFLRRPHDPEQYLREAISAKSISTLGRHSRRLSEIGKLNFVSLGAADDVQTWISSFLDLEASGWKGKAGTAMKCREKHGDFFGSVVLAAFNRRHIQMDAFLLGDRPLAARCCFRAGNGLFIFKVAFDEEYARYSPGMLLEVECMRRLSKAVDVDWVDSCAAEDHPMWGRLLRERKPIETIAVATKGFFGKRAVSFLPAARNWYFALRRIGRRTERQRA